MSEHLTKEVSQWLSLSNDERISKIQTPKWIGYPAAKGILERMEELFLYPQCDRMPNMMIIGQTNNGKTSLLKRFCASHPASDNPHGESAIVPVLYVQCPDKPDEHKLYARILSRLFAPYKSSDRADKKYDQVVRVCEQVQLKVLILDEMQHVISGSTNAQRIFLNVIKMLGNDLRIPIIAAGIPEANNAMQTDEQISNRFEPWLLHRWQLDENFLRLLASFERLIPLKHPSYLTHPDMAQKLYRMSEGLLGELSNVLVKTATLAVKSGSERITPKELQNIKWIVPSERRKEANKAAEY